MATTWTYKQIVRRVIHVDIIVALGGFCCLLLQPLCSEYIYLKVAEQYNTTKEVISHCGVNSTTAAAVLVQQEVSRMTLLLNLTMYMPASLAAMLMTSWSDKVGRKVVLAIPVAGMILSSTVLAVSIHLKWPLKSLYLYYLVGGISGYYMALLMQGGAYLSDITPRKKRGIRFVILETSLGIGGGIAGVSSGYWIDSQGFFPPVLCTVCLNVLCLLIIPLLPDSAKIRDENRRRVIDDKKINHKAVSICKRGSRDGEDDVFSKESSSSSSRYSSCSDNIEQDDHPINQPYSALDIVRSVWKIYSSNYSHCEKCHGPLKNQYNNVNRHAEKCLHGGGLYPGRVWRMWFYLISYDFNMFVIIGTMAFQTIFFLSEPLCFSPVLIGAQLGQRFVQVALAPILVWIYQKVFKLGNHAIIILSLIAYTASTTTMSFATKPFVVFLSTFLLLFGNPGKPFLQAQISSLVSETEQGAAFALLSFSEIMSFLISTATFLTLYSATVSLYHGFAWLFAAVITIIPISLISIVAICNQRRDSPLEGEREPLISQVAS